MDALGFGLENYDAIGAWRTRDGKFPVDSAGTLPGGKTFRGSSGLKAILKSDSEAFAQCLTEKMLTYALGRGLEPFDRPAVDSIACRLASGDYRFSRLVLEIVRQLAIPDAKRRGRKTIMTHRELPRRTFLRGLGTAIALPVLDAMTPSLFASRASKSSRPARMAFVYVPNGIDMRNWTPEKLGTDFELPRILASLALTAKTSCCCRGLRTTAAVLWEMVRAITRGRGQLPHRSPSQKTAGADICAGVSRDQAAQESPGDAIRLAGIGRGRTAGGELRLGLQLRLQQQPSWRTSSAPMPPEINPRLVFERLFAGVEPGESAASRAKRERYKKSILDLVSEDTRRLQGESANRPAQA